MTIYGCEVCRSISTEPLPMQEGMHVTSKGGRCYGEPGRYLRESLLRQATDEWHSMADLLTRANVSVHQHEEAYEINRRQLQKYWERAKQAESALEASRSPGSRRVKALLHAERFLLSLEAQMERGAPCPSCCLRGLHRHNCRLVTALARISDVL